MDLCIQLLKLKLRKLLVKTFFLIGLTLQSTFFQPHQDKVTAHLNAEVLQSHYYTEHLGA